MTTRVDDPIRGAGARLAATAPWLTLALTLAAAPAALAATPAVTQVTIEGSRIFPESITSTAAGDLIVGSAENGGVYRAKAGSPTATLWIDPKDSGMTSLLGVFADEKSNTLYACSLAGTAPPEKAAVLSALRAFDLKTGKAKAAYPFDNGGGTLCNDIAVTADGSAYVADTKGGRVLKLKKGEKAVTEWLKDANLAGVDGVAVAGDGSLILNTVSTSRMFKVAIGKDGAAGPLVELTPSAKLARPDGLRAIGGNRFLQAESSGRVTVVVVQDDKAVVMPIKSNYPGVTSATLTKGRVWFINAKFPYRNDPKLKTEDPGAFVIDSVELPK